MKVYHEIADRKTMLQAYRLWAGEELLTNGRTKSYKLYLESIAQLQEEIEILNHCLTIEDFPSVGEVVRAETAQKEARRDDQ